METQKGIAEGLSHVNDVCGAFLAGVLVSLAVVSIHIVAVQPFTYGFFAINASSPLIAGYFPFYSQLRDPPSTPRAQNADPEPKSDIPTVLGRPSPNDHSRLCELQLEAIISSSRRLTWMECSAGRSESDKATRH